MQPSRSFILDQQTATVSLGDLPLITSPIPEPPGFVVKKGTNRFRGVAETGTFVLEAKTFDSEPTFADWM